MTAKPVSMPPADTPSASLITTARKDAPASKAEQQFRQLVASIEARREAITRWQDYLPRYNERVMAEMAPLRSKLHTAQMQMVMLLDRFLNTDDPTRRLRRAQRVNLEEALLDLVNDLLDAGHPDLRLMSLHDAYSEVSWAQKQHEGGERLSEVDGEQGDEGEKGHQSEEGHRSDEGYQSNQGGSSTGSQGPDPDAVSSGQRGADAHGRQRNSGTAKANADRARREKAAKDVGQSVRDVYRKLASALHPDRELDEQVRARKTVLMQRVNQAYEAKDLLALLNLQLEIAQIDSAHLSSLPPKRLALYNQRLRDQLAELEAELYRLVEPFATEIGKSPASLTPTAIDRLLSTHTTQLKAAIRTLKANLTALRDPDVMFEASRHGFR